MIKVKLILVLLLSFHSIKAQDTPQVVKPFIPENLPAVTWFILNPDGIKVEVEVDRLGKVVSAKSVDGHPLLKKVSEESALKWIFSKSSENRRKTRLLFRFNTWQNEPKIVDGSKGGAISEISGKFIEPNQLEITKTTTVVIPKIELLPRINGQIEDKSCELHGVQMRTEIVDIIYGLTVPKKGFEDLFEVREKLFPNANTVIYAGCIVEPTERKEVYFCDQCRKADSKWSEARREQLRLDGVVESY